MKDFHSQSCATVLKNLKTSKKGLSGKEVEKRLKKDGLNQLEEEKPLGLLRTLLAQFKSPLIYILLAAGVISAVLKEFVDAGIIFGAVFINTIIGFFQENKANNALSKLRQMVEHTALVIRDGHEHQVKSKQLVVGDIIVLEAGNRISADARLFEAHDLQVNESSLTGESVPSQKKTDKVIVGAALADRENMVYAGTVVASGTGRAVVVKTAMDTEIGNISNLVKTTKEEKTPLQLRLEELSKLLGIVAATISVLIVIVGVLQGRDFFEMFIVGVAVAVASIPEGLVVAVTVILIMGMQQIMKEKALTRKLVAAETLGSTTVICTDKTGTLTQGKMQVTKIIVGDTHFDLPNKLEQENAKALAMQFALRIGLLCNNAVVENPEANLEDFKMIGLPTETALLFAAISAGLNPEEANCHCERVSEAPFSSETKFMMTLHHKIGKGYRIYEKGAPERVLEKSSFYYNEGKIEKLTEARKREFNKIHEELTSQGLRLIAVSFKKLTEKQVGKVDKFDLRSEDKDLIFVAFLALKDPLRVEASQTIAICRQAGIRPIIITGDHKLTASAIAKEIGFKLKPGSVITGEILDKTSDEKLKDLVAKVDVFARVSPHHKLRIVKALQSRGEVVAMTGDGINDSPALKAADIGVCLGSGTDIAKETADIVLLDDNFKVIVSAVKQGRVIFSNIRKSITYLISDSFSEVILILGSIIMGAPLAILPTQILWVNIVNDGLPNFSLAFEKEEEDVMSNKPISRKEPIINKEMKVIIFVAGIIRDLFIFGMFFYLLKHSYDISYIRTLVFATVGLDSLLYIFSLRSLSKPIWKNNPFSNHYLTFAALSSLVLLLAAIYWPPLQGMLSTVALSWADWGIVFSISVATIAMIELSKFLFFIRNKVN